MLAAVSSRPTRPRLDGGNTYLDEHFPRLDRIIRATIDNDLAGRISSTYARPDSRPCRPSRRHHPRRAAVSRAANAHAAGAGVRDRHDARARGCPRARSQRQAGDRSEAGGFHGSRNTRRGKIFDTSARGLVAEPPAAAAPLAPRTPADQPDAAEQSGVFPIVPGRGRLQPPSNAVDAAIKSSARAFAAGSNRGPSRTTAPRISARITSSSRSCSSVQDGERRDRDAVARAFHWSARRLRQQKMHLPSFKTRSMPSSTSPVRPMRRTLTLATDTALSTDERAATIVEPRLAPRRLTNWSRRA